MRIGIGLPSAVPGVGREGVVEWARRADAAGFSTLAVLDRLAYPNLEPLACLAAAAAVTERIGLLTDVLLAPLRGGAALLAKQAATIDAIAGGGRLTLGVGVGGRPDDYEAAGVDFSRRGRLLNAQLDQLRGVVPLLVGGRSDAALRRAARYADGWAAGGGGVEQFVSGLDALRAVWERDTPPRTVALTYFALGLGAGVALRETLGGYYAYTPEYASRMIATAPTDAGSVARTIAAYDAAGADELILFPASRDPLQVELLAEVASMG
jgi:alkanesulfonate monooxygenase SsuD/methylene tetrahydromethanopterin reductase-like flavin-dependent oxidoreductase (luciferase family)